MKQLVEFPYAIHYVDAEAKDGGALNVLEGFIPSPRAIIGAPGRVKHGMELATGIEPATCGLRISQGPTSDNLSPQETTKEDAPDMGLDGAKLSCPGSGVLAKAVTKKRPDWCDCSFT
jgi:hypothetical protein